MTKRRHWNFPVLTTRNLADHVEGSCDVTLFADRWKLHITVRLKRSMFDRVDDPADWEPLRRGLWIGFDGAPPTEAFRIKRARVSESTLFLVCDYPGKGVLDRIRETGVLRLGRAADPASGVLLEASVAPVVRTRKTASSDDVPI
jgi:hypothetical protein